jgi:hypothetical protein
MCFQNINGISEYKLQNDIALEVMIMYSKAVLNETWLDTGDEKWDTQSFIKCK